MEGRSWGTRRAQPGAHAVCQLCLGTDITAPRWEGPRWEKPACGEDGTAGGTLSLGISSVTHVRVSCYKVTMPVRSSFPPLLNRQDASPSWKIPGEVTALQRLTCSDGKGSVLLRMVLPQGRGQNRAPPPPTAWHQEPGKGNERCRRI